MSEFCLDCFNKFWDKNLKENQVSLHQDFCEGCAEYKPCVIKVYTQPPKKLNLFLSSNENSIKKELLQ